MTRCTICAAPCAGRDDDDEACCAWCHAANLAGAELRPPASLTRDWWSLRPGREREAEAVLRLVRLDEDGHEGRS